MSPDNKELVMDIPSLTELVLVTHTDGSPQAWFMALAAQPGFHCQLAKCSQRIDWQLPPHALRIVILDTRGCPDEWESVLRGESDLVRMVPVVAINLHPNIETELSALNEGVQGVFYASVDTTQITEGLHAIRSGELWYRRQVLAESVRRNRRSLPRKAVDDVGLTNKEKQVLCCVASGARNEEIARHMFISPHTVKTHLYKIFRKTDSRNRIEALRWAQDHLVLEPNMPAMAGQD